MARAARPPAAPAHLPDPLMSVDLLTWYAERARELPWRGAGASPYRSWVSEVMLQQTRVEVVRGYFNRWMLALPTVEDLANAPLDDVLALWSGLGYYSRARNLHAGAKAVVAAGGFPTSFEGWRALPGVGDYIAGAVCSIALGLDEPAVDGNLERVLARVHSHPGGRAEITALARRLLPAGRAGDWNQALMDLGSSLCGPKSARCEECPLLAHCGAGREGQALEFPLKKAKRVAPARVAVGALLRQGEAVLLGRRQPQGLFGGLFELPGALLAEADPVLDPDLHPSGREDALRCALALAVADGAGLHLGIGALRGTVDHTLTHMRLQLYVFDAEVLSGAPVARVGGPWDALRWILPSERASIGLSTLATKALDLPLRPAQTTLF